MLRVAEIELCRCCGQPLPPKKREGVYLPSKKALIYDTVRDHPGITAEGIAANFYPNRMLAKTVRVHIVQINDLMAGTDVRIKGDFVNGKSDHGGYRVVRRKRRR